MSRILNKLQALMREEDGLTTVEYAIAGSLVGLAVIGAFTTLGTTVGGVICDIVTKLGGGCAAAP
jgi:pilus assembly protein Flp/PilA